MKLITGGAFQGKRKYVSENYNIQENDMVNGEICDFDCVFIAPCIYNFHKLIKRLIEENIDWENFIFRILRENPDAVIILDEIGCGIIPSEKSERIYREVVGKCGCMIAEKSHFVVRIFASIPVVLKDNL